MKKILISALIVLFIFAFSYFATAFVTLEFNPKEWAKGVRFFIVFIPTFVSIGFVHIYNLD